ncbi:Uncharacterised protein [Dermatophilus congolensis]|uniref:Uncharacterized protein n=1 Tax=Dermatophilus congolensis TaxID=1863 RepID=A0AA46H170_9MICO|nr:Uncharacterised protein [Dermatophilus congolensis]
MKCLRAGKLYAAVISPAAPLNWQTAEEDCLVHENAGSAGGGYDGAHRHEHGGNPCG